MSNSDIFGGGIDIHYLRFGVVTLVVFSGEATTEVVTAILCFLTKYQKNPHPLYWRREWG